MSAINYKDLKTHVGHKIVCVGYSNPPWKFSDKKPILQNVAVECETCNEVLLDFDKPSKRKIKNEKL